MKKLLFVLSFIALQTACSGQDYRTIQTRLTDGGIVGGELVAKNSTQAKMAVLVRGLHQEVTYDQGGSRTESDFEVCTGAFITDDIVLTAAHCIFENPYKLEIVYTTDLHDLSAPSSEVESVLKYPDYKKENTFTADRMDNDIALIKIKGTRPADYQVAGLTAWPKTENSFQILSIGFGRTTGVEPTEKDPDQGVGLLRATTSTAVSFDPGVNYFVIDQSTGHGVCQGDSGGPALVSKDGRYYILGVAKAVFREGADYVNAGPDDDSCKYKSAYMNVPSYLPWINESIRKLEQKN
jgi:trypsin